jgi:hypothetical protein
VEGLEAFVEKKTEHSQMLEDMTADLEAVTREQQVYADGLGRAAKLAEERRLQEFQRALEHMGPAEAEAAQKAEQERALRLQKECDARAAALQTKIERARARVREKYSRDNWYYSKT